MKILSIDLAIKQSGFAYYDTNTKELITWTIKETLGSKYKVLDLKQMRECWNNINASIRKFTTFPIYYIEKIIIEWNSMSLSHLLEKFSISFISYGAYQILNDDFSSRIQPIQANRWMKVANDIFSIKRNKYDKGKEGNKKWISDIATHLQPSHKFNSQDEKDAYVMLITYLEKQNRF